MAAKTPSPRMLAALLAAGQALETAQKSERDAGAARGSVGTSSAFESTLMAVWLWARHEHHTDLELFAEARSLGWRYLLEASLEALPETLDPDSTQPFCASLLLWAVKAEAELSPGAADPARLAMGDLAADALRRLLVRSAGAGPKTVSRRGRFDEGFWVWSLAEFARATGDERGLRVATNHVDHFFGTGPLPSPLDEPMESGEPGQPGEPGEPGEPARQSEVGQADKYGQAVRADELARATQADPSVHSAVTVVGPAPEPPRDGESPTSTAPYGAVSAVRHTAGSVPKRLVASESREAVSTASYGVVASGEAASPGADTTTIEEALSTGELLPLQPEDLADDGTARQAPSVGLSDTSDEGDQLLSTSATRGLATLSVLGVTPFAGLWVRERVLSVLPEAYLAEGRSPSWNASIGWLLGYIHGQRLLPIPAVRDRYDRIITEVEHALGAPGYRPTPFAYWSLAMAFETMAKEAERPTRNPNQGE